LFVGAEPGPTLLVQAVVHGPEVIGAVTILNFIQRLDPRRLRGQVVAVPVINRVGFDLSERGSRIDGKDINRLFPGNPRGSVSDQIAYVYFEEVIRQANVLVDFHAASHGYERYVVFPEEKDSAAPTEIEQQRRKLIVAFGLDAAAFFPADAFGEGKTKQVVEAAGVVKFDLELGGGAGWLKNGEENVRVGERGIWNIMKAMRMIEGEFEADGPLCTVYDARVILWKPPVDGLFIRRKRIGDHVAAGEVYGAVVDPYTGAERMLIRSPEAAIVLPSGREWPTMGSTTVGILGVVARIEDRRSMDMYVS
jgi:predicted deacylase